jgi:hypothetical protein
MESNEPGLLGKESGCTTKQPIFRDTDSGSYSFKKNHCKAFHMEVHNQTMLLWGNEQFVFFLFEENIVWLRWMFISK